MLSWSFFPNFGQGPFPKIAGKGPDPGARWNKNYASQRQYYAQKMQDAQVTKSLPYCSWWIIFDPPDCRPLFAPVVVTEREREIEREREREWEWGRSYLNDKMASYLFVFCCSLFLNYLVLSFQHLDFYRNYPENKNNLIEQIIMQPICNYYNNWASARDFQQCDILTWMDSDELLRSPFKLRNSKWCSVSSLTIIKYSSD